MLGVLAKYIFGSMMGDAPETTAPELQYHTREVNDWLLVDMPDQAIDDEDMDSESDDDEILTALPLLMAEEVIVQPLQIVQSYEDVKDYSVCDNSYKKVQQLNVDKIRSVPSAVQHHSGDKTQGNFVDNVEVEDNFSSKIQDISATAKENFEDIIIPDKFHAQDISVQINSDDLVQELFVSKNQPALCEVQTVSDGYIKSNSAVEVEADYSIESFDDRITDLSVEFQDSIHDEEQNISYGNLLDDDFGDEIYSLFSEAQENCAHKISNHFAHKNEEEVISVENENSNDEMEDDICVELGKFYDEDDEVQETRNRIEDNFCADLGKLYDEYVLDKAQDTSSRIQVILNNSQEEFYLGNSNRATVNCNYVQRRLYSQVVKMGANTQNCYYPVVENREIDISRKENPYVRIFGDEVEESSDDDMNETSDDEMNENSEEERESANDDIKEKSCDSVIRDSSDEESEDYSEDETADIYEDFHKRFYYVPNKRYYKNRERRINETEEDCERRLFKIMDMVLKHNVACIPNTEYRHAVGYRKVPLCWYAYQTWQEPIIPPVLIRDYLKYEPTGRCPHFKFFVCRNSLEKKFKKKPLPVEDRPLSPTESALITNSAEILQNLINQKSTNLPTKTAVVLEHIKELKPVQQAIQYENRKYLTRSQLNRQNRNNMYQSSVKTNRRRNLQRNHSGANNNRKC